MRTLSQQNASRINGAKSKGPVTAEGKARVSQNGTTHGIYSNRVVLADEDPQAFIELQDGLMLAWGPVNDYEADLITDIAEARWRLARFTSLETAALDLQVDTMRPDLEQEWPDVDAPTRHILAFNELITRNRSLEVLQAAIRHQHRIIDRATSQLIRLHKMRPCLPPSGEHASANHTAASLAVPKSQLTEMVDTAVEKRAAAAPPAGTPESLQTARQQAHTGNHGTKPEPLPPMTPVARPRQVVQAGNPVQTGASNPDTEAKHEEAKEPKAA